MGRLYRCLKKLFKPPTQLEKRAQVGLQAEKLAARFLKQRGLRVVTTRFRCKQGEIDLIMWDKETLVFIEVRFRAQISYATPAETVNAVKQQKILKTARYYLWVNALHAQAACRFDVLAITGPLAKPHIQWIQAAF